MQDAHAAPGAPVASIAFPGSMPANGTGLITVSYAAAAAPPPPGGAPAGTAAVLVLRFPAGIEIASGGFEVYPGGVGMGGTAGEFPVFYAKKSLPPPPPGGSLREEVAVRVGGGVFPPRNYIDVHVRDAAGGMAAGASALLEAAGGDVRFSPLPGGAAAAAPPAEAAPAAAARAPPPAGALAAHLSRALPPGSDAAAWLAENAEHLPKGYREEVAAASGAAPGGASGASGASAMHAPAPPFAPLSSYVYGTLHSRDAGGTLRGQPGALACMYDVAGDNRTLAPLVNLGDPRDPRGACAATDASGFFGISILTLDPSDPLSSVDLRIVFSADGPRARVADAANRTYELHAATAANLSAAVAGFNVTVPDGHEFRRAMWVADAVAHAHGRLASEFGHEAPRADARWDLSSPAASSYNLTTGAMTVSSVHSAGSRHGAEAVPASVAHEYAHHVLAGLQGAGAGAGNGSGSAACAGPLRIDWPFTEECAWTDGWAHFAAAVAQGSPLLRYHGLPVAVDLEVPAYSVAGGLHLFGFAGGPAVPGNVAGALWDLYDPAGEPGDAVGGNGTAVWDATVAMSRLARGGEAPSVLGLLEAWRGAGLADVRGVLALNGIVARGAAPRMDAPAGPVEAPYGAASRIEVNATGAGGPSNMSLAGAGNGTGAPPFANMTHRYDGATDTTVATIRLLPGASDVGVHVLNVTATPAGGPSNHTLVTVNVTDRTPPRFASVPWDVTVEATGSLTRINATALGVSARDEADPLPRLSHDPAGPLPLGGHYVRWTATDASNNSAAATMYLTIVDTTPPAFSGVANLTLAFAPGERAVARYAAPSATDLVDGPVEVRCSPPPGSPIGWGGPTRVSCEAADRSGNRAQAGFEISAARDGPQGPPAVSASNRTASVEYNRTARIEVNATGAGGPSNMSLAGAGNGTGAPPFANMTHRYDGATDTTVATIRLLPGASDVGVHVLNVTATPAGGPSNHTLVTVNVTDRTPPRFASVPWDVTVEATGSLTRINATALGVSARDEADPLPRLSHDPAGPLPLGGHYVRWTATDASNNSAAATMYLTIVDTTPPAFGGVANLTLAFAPGARPAAAYAVPNATDLVDGEVRVSCSPPPGSPIPWGPTTVSCDAGDRSGNYAWALFVVNATRDGTLAPPVLAAQNSSVAVEYNRTVQVEIRATGAGPASISLAAAGGGNPAAPAPAFANLTQWYDGNGTTAALVTLAPNASDVGQHAINVTARTRDGLSSHALILVNVTDSVPPRLASVPWDVTVEATGSLTRINATELGVRAHDEADPHPVLSRVPAGPLPLGYHIVRWTATDASNNSAAAEMRLLVADTTPPSFSGTPANASMQFAPGEEPRISYARPSATDTVDGDVAVRCLPPPGTPVRLGPTLVACDASDRSGNSARVSFWFNATGGGNLTAAPRLALSNSSVAVPYGGTWTVRANATGAGAPATFTLSSPGAEGNATEAPAFASLEHVRAGGNATAALITLSPNASDIGVHRINVTAASRGSPPAHAVLTVNVTDGTPPRLHAPAHAVVEATGNLTSVNASALGIRAADAVDPSPSLSAAPPGPLPLGVHGVRWTATDASGNEASAWMRLAVRDTTPPAFGGAPNVTLAFSAIAQPVANYTTPPASDLVDGMDVRVRCLPPQGSFVSWGLTQVVCVALDSSGNAAWARFWMNATASGG